MSLVSNSTAPERGRILKQRARALELRIEGFTHRAIAGKLKCSVSTVHKYVEGALADARSENHETANELREIELARLDKLTATLTPLLKNPERALGAASRLVLVSESRRKLLGLDQPTKYLVAVHGKIEHVPDRELMPAVLAELEQSEEGRELILLAAARIRALPAANVEGASE